MAELLEQIILSEDIPAAHDELDKKHVEFWRQAMQLPEKVRPFLKEKEPECTAIPDAYSDINGILPASAPSFPTIRDYKTITYLHVAAALFMSFMADEDVALRILQNAESSLEFTDYGFMYVMGTLLFYQGKPGDLDQSYFGYLNRIRKVARVHIETLKKAKQKCTGSSGNLLCREQAAEFTAMNSIVYFLAEDLARENTYASPYRARMEEYANDIKHVLDGMERETAERYYALLIDNKYIYLDTYAYATLVAEAQKPDLDRQKLRKLVADFDRVVEHVEEDAKQELQKQASKKQARQSDFRIYQ